MKNQITFQHLGKVLLALVVAGLAPGWGESGKALAAVTDVAPVPIFSAATQSTEVKPNVLFVLDDSGSMAWDFMPDKANDFSGNYGFASSQCNGVYYNPAIIYTPPLSSTGASYANSSFATAWNDGYTKSSTTNLNSSFKSNSSDTAQPAYYYVYSGNQTTEKQKDYYNSNSIFYKECNSVFDSTVAVDGVNPVNTLFTKRIVSATSGPGGTDELVNFANWYSYYRTRMLMMKTASGQAFNSMSDHFRVGFITINANSSSEFLNISDFNTTQKSSWYSKLYATVPGSSTPLREALSYSGQIYAGKKPSVLGALTFVDPVQYSCQQNYTILSTDGFWNGTDTNVKKLDSNVMDNQDGGLPRPYNDGADVIFSKRTSQVQSYQTQIKKATDQLQKKTTQLKSSTSTLQRQVTQLQTRTLALQQQTSQLKISTSQLLSSTSSVLQTTHRLQSSTSTNSGASYTSWADDDSCVWDTSGSSRKKCQYVADPVEPVSTCRVKAKSTSTSSGATWTGDATACSYDTATTPSPVSSCTTSAKATSTSTGAVYNPATACSYQAWTSYTGSPTCTTLNQSTGSPYTVGTAQRCQTLIPSAYASATSCSVTTTPDADGYTTQCRYLSTTYSAWSGVSACSPVAQSTGPDYEVARQCQSPVTTAYANASSCTATTTPDASGRTTQCRYTSYTSTTGSTGNVSTCTQLDQSTDPNYTVGTATNCSNVVVDWAAASSCSPGTLSGLTTECQTVSTEATPVASCTCTASVGSTCTTNASSSNSYTKTTCSNAITSPGVGVASCTPVTPTSANNFTSTNCTTVNTGPTSTNQCTDALASAVNNYTATTCTVGATTLGTSNTLADVAAYYYNTNLRTSTLNNCAGVAPSGAVTDLCVPNKVPANGLDTATWQHMTTFTLGLGARGRMVFSPTYLTDTTGDYYDVWKGNVAGANNCTWQASGTVCNWPTPGSDRVENIDDLWHAAINGHGNYFSATDPATLTSALSSSLNTIINTPQPGTAASAATTNPKITASNNFQFSSYFMSVEWTGELIRQTMNLTDGTVPAYDHTNPNPAAYDWSAQTLLDARLHTDRTIYTKGTSGLIAFTWSALNTAALQDNFTAPNISTAPPAYPTQLSGLSQFCATVGSSECISAAAQTTSGAAGEALVNFLRGDRSNEEGPATDPTKFFRHRTHILGDIVSAQPQYVGPPSKNYTDAGYAAFKTAQAARAALVFAAANDGMLHAFNATTGVEEWAYIPSFVLPRLYTLADKKYADKHQYFVEGTPKSSDVYIDGVWKTILVGGLNGGGTGYYALDITNPATPVFLWEYTNVNMGFSFGNPEITKLDDGTWVVLVTSGYNNCPRSTSANCVKNATGNGYGYLYVLNAATGALISSSTAISTATGSSTTPSGLGRIIAQATAENVTTRVYGGDLLGNLWRFSIGSTGYSQQLLATFQDASGNPQPITARPQVTTYNGNPLVYVGTGRYLGTSDVGGTSQQTFYGVKDNLGTTSYGNPRSSSSFISKTAVSSTCPTGTDISICDPGTQVRKVTQNNGAASDSLSSKDGWFVDFPAGSGELAFTDPKLVRGTLTFSTSVPTASTSVVCGTASNSDPVALGYMVDFLTGGAVGTTTEVIASVLGSGIATTPQIAQLPDGTVIAKYRLSTGQEVSIKLRINNTGTGTSAPKRVSWRELVTE